MKFKKLITKLFFLLPLTIRVRIYFFYRHKYPLSLSNPVTFSEKINHRKLNPLSIYTLLADKYSVRDYVSNKVGNSYLIPLRAVVSDTREFPVLEGKYVAKTTHGSGPDNLEFLPSQKSIGEIREKFKKALSQEFRGVSLGELHYASIERKVIIEERIGGDDLPVDFKFHVFENNGKPVWFLQVDSGRYKKHIRNYYDSDLNLLDLQVLHPNGPYELPKRCLIEKMSEVAISLASGLSYARIDLYLVNGRVYFGEITLTPGSGFEKFSDRSIDIAWGKLWR